MTDAYKYGTIKLSYEYLGDEYGSSHPHKVDMVLTTDVSREELLERFEAFMKAIGYYFNPGECVYVLNYDPDEPVYTLTDEMPQPEDWLSDYNYPPEHDYFTMHDENGMAYSIGISGADSEYDVGALGAGDYSYDYNLNLDNIDNQENTITISTDDSIFEHPIKIKTEK